MNKIHNHKHLEECRKELRKNLTSAEATLWKHLQRSQLSGRKFRRQHSIQNYIVDFYCSSEKLIIELDGAYHLDFAQQNYDYERTLVLESLGLKVFVLKINWCSRILWGFWMRLVSILNNKALNSLF